MAKGVKFSCDCDTWAIKPVASTRAFVHNPLLSLCRVVCPLSPAFPLYPRARPTRNRKARDTSALAVITHLSLRVALGVMISFIPYLPTTHISRL